VNREHDDRLSSTDARRRARQGTVFLIVVTAVVMAVAIGAAVWMYWLADLLTTASPAS
jgi:ferric-dicitrate binding protein FerR (iron transport regulator)